MATGVQQVDLRVRFTVALSPFFMVIPVVLTWVRHTVHLPQVYHNGYTALAVEDGVAFSWHSASLVKKILIQKTPTCGF